MKNYLVLIPARAGSQRLPGKNMHQLGDKPLLGHSIAYALKNGLSDIVVTSNDAAILDFATQNEVQIVERPNELAGNEEPVITALQHAVDQLQKKYDMPHSSYQRELNFSKNMTEQLTTRADLIVFSSYTQDKDKELKPSNLISNYKNYAEKIRFIITISPRTLVSLFTRTWF